MATTLEHCQIHPSPITDHELSLPLTHFDIPFLQSDPTQRLIFFDHPISKPHFMQTIVPQLKNSLALVLTRFLPLAGNIIFPTSGRPVIRYALGNSISLTISECDNDFHHLTGNHQREADEFYSCVPQLPPTTRLSDDSILLPVVALKITLFPEKGICIGLTNYHALADGSSIINFMKTWALLNRFGSNIHVIDEKYFPSFDRTMVQDEEGLDSRAWNLVNKSRAFPIEPPPRPSLIFPINKVRATFIMTKNQVQSLKEYVLANRPNIGHISSFLVICAYIWTCSEKSVHSAGVETNNDEPVYFSFAADCRARLNPPLPQNYFGNCVVFVAAQSRHGLIKGNEGFVIAAKSIADAIKKTLYSEKGILDGSDWPVDFKRFSGRRVISVAGSPRFDVYEVDYGWGNPKKHEFVHLDREKSISLCKSREFEGGFEIGLSRTKVEMDVFEGLFNQGLEMFSCSKLI
ncbi:hypothetical protein BUALT_Bualt18G0019100 [Buddleja alternifolia]|uniref:Uncharacterized protein n=1 Tax=Buddleja alternifolia TaxID=168488 RepID=A0AAV6W7Y3_9LAMI|nr:hypothetical protein BUALT_Bualt18G0019100 [Buddleja alternifolia]